MVRPKTANETYQRQWTPRELSFFTIVSHQRALRLDQVPRFVAFLEPPSGSTQKVYRKSTAHHLVEYLHHAGLLHLYHFGKSQPVWIWLTKRGWHVIGNAASWKRPVRSALPQRSAINAARLLLTEHDPAVTWVSQQQLPRKNCPLWPWAREIRGPPVFARAPFFPLTRRLVGAQNHIRTTDTDPFYMLQKENSLMIGCAFFDDEQPTNGQTDGLPLWATITEVSDFLAITRNAVRSAVRRAVFNQEAWVKKVTSEGGSTFYVINTSHETYQSHQERWKQQKALQAACLRDDLVSPYAAVRHAALLRREDVLQRWPHFRQWLSSQGIQIFQNLLAEEGQKKWEWRWGELHGEGCESEEIAVIAVLQNRFDANAAEHKEHENRAFFHALEPQHLQKSPRKSFLFGSKDPRSH